MLIMSLMSFTYDLMQISKYLFKMKTNRGFLLNILNTDNKL